MPIFLFLAVIVLILWLGGFFIASVGGIVHVLLIVALVLFIAHFWQGRGTAPRA